jgi:hypothetical protein
MCSRFLFLASATRPKTHSRWIHPTRVMTFIYPLLSFGVDQSNDCGQEEIVAELDRTKLPLTRSSGHQKVVFDINPHVNDADELALHEYAHAIAYAHGIGAQRPDGDI